MCVYLYCMHSNYVCICSLSLACLLSLYHIIIFITLMGARVMHVWYAIIITKCPMTPSMEILNESIRDTMKTHSTSTRPFSCSLDGFTASIAGISWTH